MDRWPSRQEQAKRGGKNDFTPWWLLPPWDARVRDPVRFWGSVAGSAHIKPRFEHFHFWKPLHSSVDWRIRQLQRSADSCWWICVLSYFVLFLGKRNLWTAGNLRDMLCSTALTREGLKWETQTAYDSVCTRLYFRLPWKTWGCWWQHGSLLLRQLSAAVWRGAVTNLYTHISWPERTRII